MARRQLSELKQDPANLNKHAERGSALTRKSIERFGARLAGIVDKNGYIIDGNDRQIAYGEIDFDEVEVIEADPNKPVYLQFKDLDLADPENPARELQVALHRSAVESFAIDAEALLAHMGEGLNVDEWFRQDELDELLADLMPKAPAVDPGPQIDKAEELRQKWNVSSGDLWQLGDHRLICGDCTDKATVERVMGGERADITFTDPPYNVDVAGGSHDPRDEKNYRSGNTVANDKLSDADFYDFLCRWILLALDAMKDGAAFYVCFSDSEIKNFVNAFCQDGIHYSQMIIWKKQQLVFGRKDYHSKHEPILYGWKVGAAHYFVDDRTQDTVWEIDRPMRSEKEHPTQKPVALYEKAIANSSKAAAVVYEPFCGSGTSLIACETLGRKCRAVEISPGYVAVALQRWADMTAREPVRLG